MQNRSFTKKCWLKISYEEQSYEPVLVIREIDSLRSLVIDDYGDIDKNQEYEVETSMLVSRGQYNQIGDLQELPFINYPQILQKLSQTSGPDKLQSKKYITIGNNIKVDMNNPSKNTNKNTDPELQNFYKQQITSLLNPKPNSQTQQKIIMILSEQNTNPHYYLNILFQYFNNNRHLWQHQLKLDKIHIIFQKLLSDVSLECKIGFAQNISQQNQIVTNTMFMHLKPYMPIAPRYKFTVSQKLINITNTDKFHKIYKGPIPIDSQASDDQLHIIIDAFTSLGIEIKTINSLFKLLSIIANLNALNVVDSKIQITNIFRDQLEIKAVFPQLNDDNLASICSLLQMKPQKIEDLILDPEVQQPLVSPTKQNSDKSSLGKKQICNYKLHIFKFILYEMFITKICQIINKRIFSHKFINEALVRNNQFSNKYLIVLSYGVLGKDNSADLYPNQILDQLDDDISQRLSKKILNIMKDSIIQTISYDKQSHTNKSQKQKNQKITTDYFFPTKDAKQKIQQLQNHISYKASLLNEINSLSGFFTSRILSARRIDLLKKQLDVYNLYCKMSQFMIFSEISMKLFFDTTKKAILKQLPYTFYGPLWNVANKDDLQQISELKNLIVITNNKFLIEDQTFVGKIGKKVLKQINKRKPHKIIKVDDQINQVDQKNNNEQKFVPKQENKNEPLKSLNQSKKNNQNNQKITRQPDKKVIEKKSTTRPLNETQQSKKMNNNPKEEILQKEKESSNFENKNEEQKSNDQKNNPDNYQKLSKGQEIQTKSPGKSQQRRYQKAHLYSSQKTHSKTNQPQTSLQPKPFQIPKKQKMNIEENPQNKNLKKDPIEQNKQNQKNQNIQNETKNNEINQSHNLEKQQQSDNDPMKMNQDNEPKAQDQKTPLKKEEILEQNKDFKKKTNNYIKESEPINQKQQKKSNNQVNKNEPLKQKNQKLKQNKPSNIITASPKNSLQPQNKSTLNQKQVDRTKLSNGGVLNQKQKQKMNAKQDFLTSPRPIKKNQNQFIQKSQNLEQLSRQQFTSLKDRPNYTLEQWQKKSKLKFLSTKQQNKCLFTKYGSMSERISAKIYKSPKPSPDEQILTTFMQFNYLDCTRKILNCNDDEQTQTKMLSNQGINKITQPLLKAYPINNYPEYYKSAFNSILKIGQQKNTTRSLQKLLNQIIQPLIKSYYEQIQKARNIFDQEELIPCNYSSHHNVIKDEIFMYFVKQITTDKHDKLPQKCMNAYLFGLSVLTRYFCPSPVFLYPFTHYIYFIHKFAIEKNRDKVYINLLESIFQNLLFFIEATQGFKRNPVNAFIQDHNHKKIFKNQLECAEYLHLRKTPITQIQLNKPTNGQKPQPPVITVWLVNNQSFMFPIRNQIVRTLKKKVLSQIGFLDREQCFSLYYLQPNLTYTMIDQKQKVINLLTQIQPNKPKQQRRSIYLRITYYFPFVLKDLNTLRLVYMNMISDEILLPWKAEKYQFVVAQSMAYEDYQELRIGNYLFFTGQMNNTTPNLNPIQQKLKTIYQEAQNKVCEYEYMKYMKQMQYFLMKCFRSTKVTGYFIGVKPQQILFFQGDTLISSIQIKRVMNVYLVEKKIVLQILYKNTLTVGYQQQYERLRTLTIQNIQKIQQLFKTILFYLQNSLHTEA